MKKYDRLIFVDQDGTTRAAAAEILMKTKYLLGPLRIFSRGLVVLFPEPINQKMGAVLENNGFTAADFTAQQLQQEDITERTLILTMEDHHKEKIWMNYSNARNVYTIAEYIGLQGDLPPVYGEPLEAVQECFETLDALTKGLVIKLNEEELKREEV